MTPSTTGSYTVSLTSDPLSVDRAQRATIGIPTGFSVDPASVHATTSAVAGACDAATWVADGGIIIADQKIQLLQPGADTNALCPGATLSVTFTAVSAATDGTYSWTGGLLNDVSGPFTPAGAGPSTVVDGTQPTATIIGKPSNPSNDRSPSFVFSANEPSSFECKLDGAAFTPCSSPQTYADLADGNHTVSVRATDTAGNLGPATSYNWTIDTAAPTATITSKPSNPTNSTAASFAFTASESGGTFSCRLDGGTFEPCTSTKSYTGLGDGLHNFEVRATDPAGNTGTVDAFAWTIDTAAPTASITAKPTNPSRDGSPSFEFAAGEGGSSFSCRLDGQAFAACVSVKTLCGARRRPAYIRRPSNRRSGQHRSGYDLRLDDRHRRPNGGDHRPAGQSEQYERAELCVHGEREQQLHLPARRGCCPALWLADELHRAHRRRPHLPRQGDRSSRQRRRRGDVRVEGRHGRPDHRDRAEAERPEQRHLAQLLVHGAARAEATSVAGSTPLPSRPVLRQERSPTFPRDSTRLP